MAKLVHLLQLIFLSGSFFFVCLSLILKHFPVFFVHDAHCAQGLKDVIGSRIQVTLAPGLLHDSEQLLLAGIWPQYLAHQLHDVRWAVERLFLVELLIVGIWYAQLCCELLEILAGNFQKP